MTQYVLQKLNDNKNRRFIAKTLGAQGATAAYLRSAMTWEDAKEAEKFRLVNNLTGFEVVLSDGTDDVEKEAKAYWSAK